MKTLVIIISIVAAIGLFLLVLGKAVGFLSDPDATTRWVGIPVVLKIMPDSGKQIVGLQEYEMGLQRGGGIVWREREE